MQERLKKYVPALADTLLSVVTLLGCFLILEYSTADVSTKILEYIMSFSGEVLLLNVLTLGIALVFLLILTNRVWLSCLLLSCFCGIIGVINYYVIQLHGMPMSFLLIKNFTTAMNVISSYHLEPDDYVLKILILTAVLAGFCLLVWRLVKTDPLPAKRKWIRNILLSVLCCGVVLWGYLGPDPVKPDTAITWSWQEAYSQYGYVPCTLETFARSINTVTRPEGYSEELIGKMDLTPGEPSGQRATPDIILIMNETFYDLRQIMDLQTDAPFMENIESLENAITGYAVVPNVGGGTNASEYELLTGNSMQLMPGVTPFNALNLYNANSIVSHLNGLGYHSLAAHAMDGSNYSRGVGYPALGFETIRFQDDFQFWGHVPGRAYMSDKSNYENAIYWYEQMPEDRPRFLYTLTIQNHGSWDQADPEDHSVHANADYDPYDQIVDEFLTCMDYSDEAFVYLTEYFSSVERPVIVCMVGDHSPNFASLLAEQSDREESLELLLRKVPFVIWSNFEMEALTLPAISINYLVPTILELGNVESSAYYDYMQKLRQQVPILTTYGKYYDTEGNAFDYRDTAAPCYRLVRDYFCLEYHNICEETYREYYFPAARQGE